MVNSNPKVLVRAFNMRADDDFFDAVEEMRTLMHPIPSKADAVRAAVFNELARLRASKGKRK